MAGPAKPGGQFRDFGRGPGLGDRQQSGGWPPGAPGSVVNTLQEIVQGVHRHAAGFRWR
jgi:hypothetical protein